MRLLFTGASGFLGNNTFPLLRRMYDIMTIGLLQKDDYTVNIAKEIPELYERYDIILHAAGKAHSIPRSEVEKQAFFDVNCKVQRIFVPHWKKQEYQKLLSLFLP